jgi:predicted DNA-binding transcriptional regulator AlpA
MPRKQHIAGPSAKIEGKSGVEAGEVSVKQEHAPRHIKGPTESGMHGMAGVRRQEFPPLLCERLASEFLGISQRKFAELRSSADWLPQPVKLGPRALRWVREELLEALTKRAPRGGGKEPAQLLRSRIERMKAGG